MPYEALLDPDPDTPFIHSLQHDLQSFIWVLFYLMALDNKSPYTYHAFFPEFPSNLNWTGTQKYVLWTNQNKVWTRVAKEVAGHPLWNAVSRLREELLSFKGNDDAFATLYDQFDAILAEEAEVVRGISIKRKMPDSGHDEVSIHKKMRPKTKIHYTPTEEQEKEEEEEEEEDGDL